MTPSDTKPKVQQHFDELWQNLSLEERFLKGLEWTNLSREMLLAGFRTRFPHLSEDQIRQKLAQELYGILTFKWDT